MTFLPSAAFSLLLLVFSGVLMFVHWRSWKVFQQEELSPTEMEYRRRQYCRRMLASGMIGVIGVVLFIGMTFFLGRESLIPWIDDLVAIMIYWIAVVMITLWMILLALVDVWATRQYLTRICEAHLLEQTELHANMLRQKRELSEMPKPSNGEHMPEDLEENR